MLLSGCQGIFSGVYDEPQELSRGFEEGRIVVDASDWKEWHYIDLNTQSVVTMPVPVGPADRADSAGSAYPPEGSCGIYTYWYDVFGSGIGTYEFRGFMATASQPEPASWTFAVHRNNVRTKRGGVCETPYTSIGQLPADREWLRSLDYTEDEWNSTDVWTVNDRMLSGLVGSQGICVNKVLSRWLTMVIPPMPPSFSLDSHVFILRLDDGTFAALQLADYMSASGTKCCLTINYKYPL